MATRKPSVNTNPGANTYAGPGERIVEYSSPAGGGLIAFRVGRPDGARADVLTVDLYQHDPWVEIRVGCADGAPPPPRLRPVLELSTAHLPEELGRTLGDVPGVSAQRLEVGWLLWVPDDPRDSANAMADEVPPEVLHIQGYARAWHCDYVLFDRDADPNPALPTWEW